MWVVALVIGESLGAISIIAIGMRYSNIEYVKIMVRLLVVSVVLLGFSIVMKYIDNVETEKAWKEMKFNSEWQEILEGYIINKGRIVDNEIRFSSAELKEFAKEVVAIVKEGDIDKINEYRYRELETMGIDVTLDNENGLEDNLSKKEKDSKEKIEVPEGDTYKKKEGTDINIMYFKGFILTSFINKKGGIELVKISKKWENSTTTNKNDTNYSGKKSSNTVLQKEGYKNGVQNVVLGMLRGEMGSGVVGELEKYFTNSGILEILNLIDRVGVADGVKDIYVELGKSSLKNRYVDRVYMVINKGDKLVRTILKIGIDGKIYDIDIL